MVRAKKTVGYYQASVSAMANRLPVLFFVERRNFYEIEQRKQDEKLKM